MFFSQKNKDWECSWVVEDLPSMWKSLGLILSTAKKNRKKKGSKKKEQESKCPESQENACSLPPPRDPGPVPAVPHPPTCVDSKSGFNPYSALPSSNFI
jgi:hypothetical protein